MKIFNSISIISILTLIIPNVSYGAPMTSQIRRLLEEKEEKVKQLEACDGKRKGWMIAGISTIGLTAVGVGVNIAQANKSNKLSNEIDSAKQELDRYEYKLSEINNQISAKERERAEIERQRAKADCEKIDSKWWNPQTERCEDKPQEKAKDIEIRVDHAPRLDLGRPSIGDKCNGGAGTWVEDDSATEMCNNQNGLVKCKCQLNSTAGPLFTGGVIGEPCSTNLAAIRENIDDGIYVISDNGHLHCKMSADDPGWTRPCECMKKEKADLVGGLSSKKPGLLASGVDGGLQGLDTHKVVNKPGTADLITELKPINSATIPGASDAAVLRQSNISDSHVGPWDISESDCYKQVEDYLALNCKKCISMWMEAGEEVCKENIDTHKGFSRVEQYEVVLDRNGYPEYTSLRIFAKDGNYSILNCNGVCADFDAEDAQDCRMSGGEWRYSNESKKFECHCGTIGSYTDRHMRLNRYNKCECQTGYVLIDEDQPIKGCRLGSDKVAIDNVINKANALTNKWNAVSEKVRQCELAANNVEGATNLDLAEKYFDQTRQFAQEAMKLVRGVNESYSEFLTAYNNLSDNDKKSVKKDKTSADIVKDDAGSVQKTVDAYVKKATDNFARVVAAENAKTKAQQQPNSTSVLRQSCIDSHGDPNGNTCICDSKKNLLPDGPNACKCKTVGKNKYEWHDKCNMCRAPNAVDNDLPCGQ